MQQLTTSEDVREFLTQSNNQPVLIFKHSTTCPISAAANKEVTAYEKQSDTQIGLIRVIEERPISLELADTLQVRHQSPQAIVVRDGKAVWNTSHFDITVNALTEAIAENR
ncbi:bacillithiol system redox-active protein YtxJ [Alicyclobacillus sp. SO9]|uniref:bacillithiol system redox-active protein YtxJ n=1 Tax=Alicyclobacillus sp. SO9 TaxID=2665646 RepID=UPI001E3DB2C3|nr:bacillithiol system redox-active protein YtxJ [Alicyclobacillus sp. SO9]